MSYTNIDGAIRVDALSSERLKPPFEAGGVGWTPFTDAAANLTEMFQKEAETAYFTGYAGALADLRVRFGETVIHLEAHAGDDHFCTPLTAYRINPYYRPDGDAYGLEDEARVEEATVIVRLSNGEERRYTLVPESAPSEPVSPT